MGQLVAKLKDLFGGKKLDLILVGLANAGKSTLLNQLASNGPNPDAGNTIPTIGLNVAKFKKGKVTIKAWDLSGQQRFRDEWKRYVWLGVGPPRWPALFSGFLLADVREQDFLRADSS